MIYPSSIRKDEGQSFEVNPIDTGLYSVENAYQGRYEYFRGRPLSSVEVNSIVVADDESHCVELQDEPYGLESENQTHC